MTAGQRLLDEEVGDEPAASSGGPRVLVVACGAVAREVLAVIRLNGWSNVTLRCLPGKLHNTPQWIAGLLDAKLLEAEAEGGWDRVLVAYGDCGTGGALDRVVAAHGVQRLPGDHCYAFFAGVDAWLAMHEAEPRTFYLTDFLCRHFEQFVVEGLWLDRHPELLADYFGNYVRVVYLAQRDDEALVRKAREAADYLGLALEVRRTGYGDLGRALEHTMEREQA
ncbi:MAG TPA: DUF1638 domain-containing protein [Actinomycetota bacterium]|nr:DUF1638 domain-containing protein [Actinomycetota bacterium]